MVIPFFLLCFLEFIKMSNKMDEIKPGLFLGSVEAAIDIDLLKSNSVGAVLTISDVSLEESVSDSGDETLAVWFGFSQNSKLKDGSKKPQKLFIQADDNNAQELITYFDDACKFITENLKPGEPNGSVLVHCWAGRSRSVTLMAAYLMKTYKMGVAESLELISNARPILCPMRGFIEQLHLYARFGCRFDDVPTECKKWYQTKIEEWLENYEENLPTRNISQAVRAFIITDESATTLNPEARRYRCCRCGTSLFSSDDIVEHERGRGAVEFIHPEAGVPRRKGHKGEFGQTAVTACRESIFVDPLPWMSDVILQVDGKLHCPNKKCAYKIGSFTWIGDRCRCGRWVTPAFHMLPDRVEQRGRIALLPQHAGAPIFSKFPVSSPTGTK